MCPNFKEVYESHGYKLVAIIVSILMFTNGASLVWTSAAIPKITNKEISEGWLGESYLIGTLAGSTVAYVLLLRGPKWGLVVSGLWQTLGWTLLLFPSNKMIIYLGRAICGVAHTSQCLLMPAYTADCFMPSWRQISGALMAINSALGVCFEFSVAPFISYEASIIVSLTLSILFLLSFPFMAHESPHTLIRLEKVSKARESVNFFWISCPEPEIKQHFKAIEESVNQYKDLTEWDKMKCLLTERSSLKGCLLSLGLMIFYNISGITQLAFYMEPIFIKVDGNMESSGNIEPAEINSAIVGGVKLLAAFLSLPIIKVLGVKKTLIISLIGNSICLTLLGVYFFFMNRKPYIDDDWMPMLSITAYGVFTIIGSAMLPFVLQGELLPVHLRAPGGAVIDTVGNLFGLLSNLFFIQFKYMWEVPFWVYGITNAIEIFFIAFLIPETKDKTINDIQKSLVNRRFSVAV